MAWPIGWWCRSGDSRRPPGPEPREELGQDRRSAVEGLDLGSLIHIKDDGRIGRVEINLHDVSYLVDELVEIGRELGALDLVGF